MSNDTKKTKVNLMTAFASAIGSLKEISDECGLEGHIDRLFIGVLVVVCTAIALFTAILVLILCMKFALISFAVFVAISIAYAIGRIITK